MYDVKSDRLISPHIAITQMVPFKIVPNAEMKPDRSTLRHDRCNSISFAVLKRKFAWHFRAATFFILSVFLFTKGCIVIKFLQNFFTT